MVKVHKNLKKTLLFEDFSIMEKFDSMISSVTDST